MISDKSAVRNELVFFADIYHYDENAFAGL